MQHTPGGYQYGGTPLARGGEATVYGGRKGGREVVVKVLHAGRMPRWGYAGEPIVHQRISTHATHPHIMPPPLEVVSRFGMTRMIVYPRFSGGDLLDAILARTTSDHLCYDEGEAAVLVKQLLQALKFTHDKLQVAHLDIKPENLLLTGRGKLVLADFGLCEARSPEQCGSCRHFRRPAPGLDFRAPEAYEGMYDGKKADIWSVGMVCCCLLTGRGFSIGQLRPEKRFRFARNMDVFSKECMDFLHACTTVDPNSRPSASELLQHPWFRVMEAKESEEALALLPTLFPSQNEEEEGSEAVEEGEVVVEVEEVEEVEEEGEEEDEEGEDEERNSRSLSSSSRTLVFDTTMTSTASFGGVGGGGGSFCLYSPDGGGGGGGGGGARMSVERHDSSTAYSSDHVSSPLFRPMPSPQPRILLEEEEEEGGVEEGGGGGEGEKRDQKQMMTGKVESTSSRLFVLPPSPQARAHSQIASPASSSSTSSSSAAISTTSPKVRRSSEERGALSRASRRLLAPRLSGLPDTM